MFECLAEGVSSDVFTNGCRYGGGCQVYPCRGINTNDCEPAKSYQCVTVCHSVSQCVTVCHVSQCHRTHLHSIAQHPVKVGREDAEEEIEMDLVSETFHLSDK